MRLVVGLGTMAVSWYCHGPVHDMPATDCHRAAHGLPSRPPPPTSLPYNTGRDTHNDYSPQDRGQDSRQRQTRQPDVTDMTVRKDGQDSQT